MTFSRCRCGLLLDKRAKAVVAWEFDALSRLYHSRFVIDLCDFVSTEHDVNYGSVFFTISMAVSYDAVALVL